MKHTPRFATCLAAVLALSGFPVLAGNLNPPNILFIRVSTTLPSANLTATIFSHRRLYAGLSARQVGEECMDRE